jgi:hypothetical protein
VLVVCVRRRIADGQMGKVALHHREAEVGVHSGERRASRFVGEDVSFANRPNWCKVKLSNCSSHAVSNGRVETIGRVSPI